MKDGKLELSDVASEVAAIAKEGGSEHILVVLLGPKTAAGRELGAAINGDAVDLLLALTYTLSSSIPFAQLQDIMRRVNAAAVPLSQPTETIH